MANILFTCYNFTYFESAIHLQLTEGQASLLLLLRQSFQNIICGNYSLILILELYTVCAL